MLRFRPRNENRQDVRPWRSPSETQKQAQTVTVLCSVAKTTLKNGSFCPYKAPSYFKNKNVYGVFMLFLRQTCKFYRCKTFNASVKYVVQVWFHVYRDWELLISSKQPVMCLYRGSVINVGYRGLISVITAPPLAVSRSLSLILLVLPWLTLCPVGFAVL